MSSYDIIKTDRNSAFFNYQNNEFNIKSFKNHGQYFCMNEAQYANSSNLSISTHEILPKNSYGSGQVFINGEKLDFELDGKQNLLYNKIVLSFDLKNEHDTQNLSLINSCLMLEKVSILRNGNEISSINDYYTWIKNMESYNLFNSDNYSDMLNVSNTNPDNNNVILPNVTKNFNITLYTSLHKSYILSSIPTNLTLRVKFKKDVIGSGSVTNADVILSNIKLLCHYIEVPNYIVSNILAHPKIDVFLNKQIYYNRILNSLTANQEQYIELDLKYNISKLKIFITDSNPTNANLLTFYSINNLYINNSSGINIINGRKLTQNDLYNTLYESYNPVNKYYFYRKKANIYVLNFSANNDVSDCQHYVSSENFKGGIYRLYFTSLQNVATSCTVHVIAYIPSLLTINKEGSYEEKYN